MNHSLKISKKNVVSNINTCKGDKQVCLMVKANTYGLGNQVLQMLVDEGYTYFGVSTLEEALNLRSLSSEVEILIVSYIHLDEIAICDQNNISFTVYDFDMLKKLTSRSKFHLKIDTNMGRLGFQLGELEGVKTYLQENELKPVGIFSHLACASNEDKTKVAIDNFKYALDVFNQFNFRYIHLLNTYGSLNYDTEFDNLVRIGIGIWGYLASGEEAEMSRKKLKPALSLDLSISHEKEYQGFISYDHIDEIDGNIITVPLGYHDGFYRAFTGYHVDGVGTIKGKVNMCQHMIELDDGVILKRGAMYNLFTGSELYKLCEYGNITTYELLVALSNRIKREIV